MRRALYLALLLGGCAQILDLEDRKLDERIDASADASGPPPDSGSPNTSPDAGDGGSPSVTPDAGPVIIPDGGGGVATTPDCIEYCTLAQERCTAERKIQLFQEFPTCLAVCNKYSKDPRPEGNTLACRLQLLRGLASTGANEAPSTCNGAGPGGGPAPGMPGSASCGTDCEGFCALREASCDRREGDVNCVSKCKALLDDEPYNAAADFTSGQDTVACRLAHLSAAAFWNETEAPNSEGKQKNRDNHCGHSGIRSDTVCDFPMNVEPDCDSYCKIMATACTGDNQQYESTAQCRGFCAELLKGPMDDKSAAASRRCLRVAAYDALEGLPNSCPRAGPPGDGCLDGRCGTYCKMAQIGCPDAFKAAFPSDSLKDCQSACNGEDGAALNSPYSYVLDRAQGGDNLYCRIRQLTIAIGSGTPNNCNAALGLAAPCAP